MIKREIDFNGTTGDRIFAYRNKKEMNQEQLASELLMNRSSLSKLEHDKRVPTVNELQTLSEIFNVSINYLMCETNNQISNSQHMTESSLKLENQLLVTNNFFIKLTKLFADECLCKLSPEKRKEIATHIYNILLLKE